MSENNPRDANFYYTSKASSSERDAGCESFCWQRVNDEFKEITREKYKELDVYKKELRIRKNLKREDEIKDELKKELGSDYIDKEFKHIDPDKYNKPGDIRITTGNPHPTIKPIEIMDWLIEKLDLDDDAKIIDPFAGSGSTGIAALKRGVDCDLIELDENGNYERVIRGRLNQAKNEFLEDDISVWEERPEVNVPELDERSKDDQEPDELTFGDLL